MTTVIAHKHDPETQQALGEEGVYMISGSTKVRQYESQDALMRALEELGLEDRCIAVCKSIVLTSIHRLRSLICDDVLDRDKLDLIIKDLNSDIKELEGRIEDYKEMETDG